MSSLYGGGESEQARAIITTITSNTRKAPLGPPLTPPAAQSLPPPVINASSIFRSRRVGKRLIFTFRCTPSLQSVRNHYEDPALSLRPAVEPRGLEIRGPPLPNLRALQAPRQPHRLPTAACTIHTLHTMLPTIPALPDLQRQSVSRPTL